MIFAWGQWRLELRLSKPLVDTWVEHPKRWGVYRETAFDQKNIKRAEA